MASKAISSTTIFVAISAILLFASPFVHSAPADGNVKFTYAGPTGPEFWSRLSSNYSLCSKGKQQSPINIVKKEIVFNKNLKSLTRYYTAANATTLIHKGYHTELKFEAGMLLVDGKNYSLKQMHWHTPSEHTINGIQYAAELHLVHKTDDGGIAVVGILYRIGKPDSLLSILNGAFKELASDKCKANETSQVELGKRTFKPIKRNVRKYYRYIGSLTTPPCSENVVWNVLPKVRSISPEQVQALKAPLKPQYKENARPVQPLNGRRVEIPFN